MKESTEQSNVSGHEKKNVLVIDDNEANMRLFVTVLKQLPSLSVSTATNAAEAKRAAAETTPDLILLDVDLPDVLGTSLLTYFKSEPSTADVPVIMISADVRQKTISRFMASGAYDYILKPIDVVDFLNRVQLGVDNAASRGK